MKPSVSDTGIFKRHPDKHEGYKEAKKHGKKEGQPKDLCGVHASSIDWAVDKRRRKV